MIRSVALGQSLLGEMIDAVATDYEYLDYSPETAGAVLEAMALLSSGSRSMGSDLQARCFAQIRKLL